MTKMKDLKAWKLIRLKSYHTVVLFLVALATAAFVLTGDNAHAVARREDRKTGDEEPIASEEENANDVNETVSRCDLFAGRWVFDNTSHPSYEDGTCSFMGYPLMGEEYGCQMNGRKDVEYQKWRWQPYNCDLPRFNGTTFLEKIRGKRVVFVGDSLNRNQWTSLLCLIESSLDQYSDKSLTFKDNQAIFNATAYNATIEFYWSPMLVESNCDDPYNHSIRNRVIRINSIEKHARQWNDADILIFDAFMWWLEPTMTLLWGSFESSDAVYKRVEMRHRRYEMVLNTWSDWLEINVDRTKTKLFFMSNSPFHTYGESWDVVQSCYNQTEPIKKEDYWGIATDREMMQIAESVIKKLETRGLKVEYLNITHLSDYRKDAHPSIHRKFKHPPTEEQLADPKSYADCFHWCLPGLPDTWNQILYHYIINS